MLFAAGSFAFLALAIYVIFLRPVPVENATGSITEKTFKPAGTYWQYPVGLDRGFRTATPIPVAEADVFQLAVDGFPGPVFYSTNTVDSRSFSVGQRIAIQYRKRVIPFAGTRIYVIDMLHAK